MNTRPKVRLQKNKLDLSLEFIGFTGLFLFWIYVCFIFTELPDIIPTHFNFKGEADDFGSKNTIFLLPLISSILFIGLTVLNRYPHIFNYLEEITSENAEKQYTFATRLIRFLKTIIVFVFFFIAYSTQHYSSNKSENLGFLIWIILGLLMLGPVLYLIFTSKLKNKRN